MKIGRSGVSRKQNQMRQPRTFPALAQGTTLPAVKEGSLMKPKVLILFRNDDLCAWSKPAHEERLLRLFNDDGVPVTLGVVPKVRGWLL